MTDAELCDIEHGLFLLFWKSGGTSLGAVGSDEKGRRWFAPTNWTDIPSFSWGLVEAIERIPVVRERKDMGNAIRALRNASGLLANSFLEWCKTMDNDVEVEKWLKSCEEWTNAIREEWNARRPSSRK